ncbi:hypothetical protein ACHAQJ_004617 [Trichoderma viride]
MRVSQGGSVVLDERHNIFVRLPRNACKYDFSEASKPVLDRFPGAKNRDKGLTVLKVCLEDEARVTITGFGIPFANADDAEVEGWINENKPIVDNHTLLDVLRQRTFYIIIDMPVQHTCHKFREESLPPSFSYPYGTDQDWDVNMFKDLIKANKGYQFMAAYSYDDDNHHMTAVNQGNVQDVMWLDDAAIEIAATKLPAYFVRPASGDAADTDCFYLVVAMPHGFREERDAAWRRLSKTKSFLLHLYDAIENEEPDAQWECKIVDHPASVPALERHETEEYELVLFVRRPKQGQPAQMNREYVVRDFGDRTEANVALKREKDQWHSVALSFDADLPDCQRKVLAVSLFHPQAELSNPVRWGLPDPDYKAARRTQLTDAQRQNLTLLKDRMDLHRALLRGNGFYDWMTKRQTQSINKNVASLSSADTSVECRPLPVVNFLGKVDKTRADAIVNEALPEDRDRFRAYLSHRPLGLGIIAAGPGTGKTTAGAAATAAMATMFGKILCSAPTHVAVDNFAARLDKRTRAIAMTCNQGKQQSDPSRCRHHFVVRAYEPQEEVKAFKALLKDPTQGDEAAPKGWEQASRWKLHLSLAFWFLVILGSPKVRELHADDSPELWQLRKRIDFNPTLKRLRDVATGVTAWQQYEEDSPVLDNMIQSLLMHIMSKVDMFCTTPAATHDVEEYRNWKNHIACGVAVDEAANMNRADLYCVWGNTLMPCFLFGDPKQLPPTVMTTNEKDSEGNFLNRFANSSKISALQFFQASGIPVYRLTTQLRMADGMFDMVSDIIYKGVPHVYAKSCNIAAPEFDAGRALESYIQERYPTVAVCPKDKLLPVFIHTPGSRVFTDSATSSKMSPDQVKIALDFTVDLVKCKGINPSQIVIIAPYPANVGLLNKMLRKNAYETLKGMLPPSTVDSFQGQENDIVIAVMGTAYPKPGPGFTSQEQRLNVLLTRQRCGLVVVGDINVTGQLVGDDGNSKGKGKGKGKGRGKKNDKTFLVEGPNGEVYFTKATTLRRVHEALHSAGRIITIPVVKKAAESAKPAA